MKLLKLLLAVTVVALLFSECKYSFIVPEDIPIIDPDDPNNPDAPQISFATQIIPIFTAGDNCTACHTTGKQLPDLSAANAYKSLNSNRYLNDNSPAESLIYTKSKPDAGGSHKKYTEAQAATILVWIQQGAKNN